MDTPASAPMPPSFCEFEGDPDTYGLGIRIGLYLQCVSTLLAFLFLPSEVNYMVNINRCFTISVFFALLYITLSRLREEINVLDPLILNILCFFGILFTHSGVLHPNSRCSVRGVLIDLILMYAIVLYGFWLLFVAFGSMQPPCFSIENSFHKWFVKLRFAYASLLFLTFLWLTIYLLIYLFRPLIDFFRVRGQMRCIDRIGDRFNCLFRKWTLVRNLNSSPGLKSKILSYGPAIMASSTMAVFIPIIECIIYSNHVQGVWKMVSTGQLIPVVVGAFGLIDVSDKLLRKWWKTYFSQVACEPSSSDQDSVSEFDLNLEDKKDSQVSQNDIYLG